MEEFFKFTEMKNAVALILIVLGLGLGYFGFTKMDSSGKSLEIGNLELSAQDSGAKTQSYLMLGGGVICLVLGVGVLMKSKGGA